MNINCLWRPPRWRQRSCCGERNMEEGCYQILLRRRQYLYLGPGCLNISACDCDNIWTCDCLHNLNMHTYQHFNKQMPLQLNLWIVPWHLKCHSLWTCACLNICTWLLQNLNMHMSRHLNMWLVSITTCEYLNFRTHKCLHITTHLISWVSHYLPSKPSPSGLSWNTNHRNFNSCRNSVLSQVSTRSYRQRNIWPSLVTVQ